MVCRRDKNPHVFPPWHPALIASIYSAGTASALVPRQATFAQLTRLPLAGSADAQIIAAWQLLHGIGGQLRELGAAVRAAQWQAPVPAEHRQLLEAIPLNVTPAMPAPPPEATAREPGLPVTRPAGRALRGRRGARGIPGRQPSTAPRLHQLQLHVHKPAQDPPRHLQRRTGQATAAIGIMMSLQEQAIGMMTGTTTGGVPTGPTFEWQPVNTKVPA